MFFVVYLLEPGVHVVVPKSWILDLKWKNHVNYSLNKTQPYRCFWSTFERAMLEDGEPDEDYAADFGAPLQQIFPMLENMHGCYMGQLRFFSGKQPCNAFGKTL